MNLYEIDNRLNILEEYMVDSETGEMVSEDDFAEKFDEIQMELDKKIENTICFAKNLDSDVEQLKKEEKALADRRKSKENLSNRLKSNIDRYIRQQFTVAECDREGNIIDYSLDEKGLNGYKFETPRCFISYRKSQSVDITDESKIPNNFIKVEEVKNVDKVSLKKYLKDNKCDGAYIKTNINMKIK